MQKFHQDSKLRIFSKLLYNKNILHTIYVGILSVATNRQQITRVLQIISLPSYLINLNGLLIPILLLCSVAPISSQTTSFVEKVISYNGPLDQIYETIDSVSVYENQDSILPLLKDYYRFRNNWDKRLSSNSISSMVDS